MGTKAIRRLWRLLAVAVLVLGAMPIAAIQAGQDNEPQAAVPATSDKPLLDRARVLRRPALSSDARNLGLSGLVAVRVMVDPDGEVLVSRAVSGPDGLRQSASKAVRAWEFAPSADPDPVSGFVVFRFSSGEPYASIVGLREQDVASGPTHPREPEPEAEEKDTVPAGSTAPTVTRPREVRPAERPAVAAGVQRLAPATLSAIATRKTSPRYPAAATSARIEGVVIVEVEVDESGRVTSARAVSGNGVLRPAAVEAAKTWLFQPTVVEGVPTKVIGTLSFNFRL